MMPRTYKFPKRPLCLSNPLLVRLLRPVTRDELQRQHKEPLCRMEHDASREEDDHEHDAVQDLRPCLWRTLVDLESVLQRCGGLCHGMLIQTLVIVEVTKRRRRRAVLNETDQRRRHCSRVYTGSEASQLRTHYDSKQVILARNFPK